MEGDVGDDPVSQSVIDYAAILKSSSAVISSYSIGEHPVRLTDDGLEAYDLEQPWAQPQGGSDLNLNGIYPLEKVVLIDAPTGMYRVPRSRLVLR